MKTTTENTTKALDFKTFIKKGYNGWKARTETTLNGYDWQIDTVKFNNGILKCYAQGGEKKNGNSYNTFTFVVFQDPSINLHSEKLRCTEKNICKIHDKGLLKFKELANSGKIPTK